MNAPSEFDAFEPFLTRWNLAVEGAPFRTRSGRLVPVRHHGAAAILKIAEEDEERFGAGLMRWWGGDGAARVFELDGPALLLERAEGSRCLARMVEDGQDDEASRILCGIVGRLHRPREALPEAVPLTRWFAELEPAARRYGGILPAAAETANGLLADPRDEVVLHGDIHHGNVLDFGDRGWLAIDPKGLFGERSFDYANLFCNPKGPVPTRPGRLARQVAIVSEAAALEPARLLRWILAWAGLSAAWFIGDGNDNEAEAVLAVARLAAAELDLGER